VRLLSRGYGFQPLFFWQPVITTKRFKTSDEWRWVGDYTRDPRHRLLLYDAIVGERRRDSELFNDADAVDLSALFDDWKESVYIDLYHLSEAGNAAVAEAMLPILVTTVNKLQGGTYRAAGGI
jgi:hypothetical protein